MKNYKKAIIFTLATFLLITSMGLSTTYADEEKASTENHTTELANSVDTTPPILDMNSIKMDKKDVKAGDTVTVSMKADDDLSGIKEIRISYITSKFRTPNCTAILNSRNIYLKYNPETNLYEGSLKIDYCMENGKWYFNYISTSDNSGNRWESFGESNVRSALKFNVTNNDYPNIDINNSKIHKKIYHPGDNAKISIKAIDNSSAIKFMTVQFFTSKDGKPKSSKYMHLEYNPNTKLFEGSVFIDNSMEKGNWTIDILSFYDSSHNIAHMYHEDYDFSYLNFNISPETNNYINPIVNSTVIKKYTDLNHKTIYGDLYICPNTTVSADNATVTGNIYVLGSLKSSGGLNCFGTLYTKDILLKDTTNLYDGLTILSGSNSINSTDTTTYPVTDIPLRIDNESIIKNNKKINLKGATLDIADMYIDNTLIDLDTVGTFNLKDFPVGDKNSITVKYVTTFGNTITKTLMLTDAEEDLNHDGYTNITDLSMVAHNYNKTSKDSGWNSKLDLNKDGIIDIYDIVQVSNKMEN